METISAVHPSGALVWSARAPRHPLLIVLLSLWLGLWGYVLVAVGVSLWQGRLQSVGFFVLFFLFAWLLGWLIGGLLALYGLLRMLAGRETITVDPAGVTVVTQTGPFCRSRFCPAGEIRRILALSPSPRPTDFLLSMRIFGIGGETILIEAPRPLRCGAGLDAESVREVGAAIGAVRVRQEKTDL